MNVTKLAPIVAAKTLNPEALELVADNADRVYVIEADGAQYVAYHDPSTSKPFGFIGERDELRFSDEAAMLEAFEATVRSLHGI